MLRKKSSPVIHITIVLPVSMMAALKEIAQDRFVNVSEIIRDSLKIRAVIDRTIEELCSCGKSAEVRVNDKVIPPDNVILARYLKSPGKTRVTVLLPAKDHLLLVESAARFIGENKITHYWKLAIALTIEIYRAHDDVSPSSPLEASVGERNFIFL